MNIYIEHIKNCTSSALLNKVGRVSTIKWIIIAALMITPSAMALFFIKEYGVNVPVFDQWVEAPGLFDKYYRGLLSFNDLFVPNWEHRPFLGRLVILSLGLITRYNNLAEMYLSWFLLCITCILLLRIYTKYFGATQAALIKSVPVIWLLFSLRQWESLLRGDTCTWFMALLFFVLTVYLLNADRNTPWRFAFAIISGIACTFSHAVGLTVWPIGLILILLNWRSCDKESSRLYFKMVIIWCLTAIVVFVTYFVGFSMPPGYEPHYYKDQPLTALSFIFVAMGSPLALDIWAAAGIGISLLLLYVCFIGYITKRKFVIPPVVRISIMLIFFSLFTVALLVPSRSGIGLERAILSRYTTFIGLGIAGLYMLILQIDQRPNNLKPLLFGFILALMISGIIAVDSHAISVDGKAAKDEGLKAAYYVVNFETQSDEDLAGLCYGHLEFVKEGAAILKKYELNVFSQPNWDIAELTPVEGNSSFRVDIVNGRQAALPDSYFTVDGQNEKKVIIQGWAIDKIADKAAGGVIVNIDGKQDLVAMYGLDRTDVSTFYKNDALRFTGYSASFATSVLDKGKHIITLKIISADHNGYYETEGFILDVK